MNKDSLFNQQMPDFGALLESIRENGRIIRENAKRYEQERREWEQKWEEERLKREKKWEEERKRERRETERIMRKSDDRINKMVNMFTTQWGKLVEALCAPAALKLFRNSGIGIDRIYKESTKAKSPEDGQDKMEIDVLYENKHIMVATEVKTTCCTADIDYFINKMHRFKECFPSFANKTVYGAIAAIKYNQSSDEYAKKKGLFVLTFSGDETFTLITPETTTNF